jgi:outer membrane protein assembly factor BamB
MNSPLFIPILLLAATLSGADWPNWQGPSLNNHSVETEWTLKNAKVLWEKKIGVGYSSIAVADGRAFTMGHDGLKSGGKETVYCLDAKTGKTLWSDTYPAVLLDYLHIGGPCATPTVDGDRVYTLSKDGRLISYNVATGEKHWEVNMMKAAGMSEVPEWGFAGSPRILGELLLIEADFTFAWDKNTGKMVWKSQRYRHAYGTPAPFIHSGKTLLATLKTDGLVILDAKDGATLAFHKWETSYRTNATTPIPLPESKIFISTGYKRGCALLQYKDGNLEVLWENRNLSNHMNNSVIHDGFIYGFDGNTHQAGPKELVCLNLKTGETQWRGGAELRCGSLIAAGNRMILLGERGQLVEAQLSPKGYQAAFDLHALGSQCWTPPALANGMIYARNNKGTLVCVQAN